MKDRRWSNGAEHGLLLYGGKPSDAPRHVPNFRVSRDSGARKERVSTAHVESTVNQLINWRMCKKKQMRWSKPGAYCLQQLKTAAINGQLQPYVAAQPFARAARP